MRVIRHFTLALMLPVLGAGAAEAAESTERTVMPDFCSRRDVNCVLPDGAGTAVVATPAVPTQPITSTQTTPARAGFTQSGSAATTTTVVIQPEASGVTTVIAPASGGLASPSVPAVPAQVPTFTTGATASGPTLAAPVSTLTIGTTTSGALSSSTPTATTGTAAVTPSGTSITGATTPATGAATTSGSGGFRAR
jgi:hypothetical protein